MPKLIVGMMGSSVAHGSGSLASKAQVESFLAVVQRHGVRELDTARVYNGGRSEELLGEVGAGSRFAISTKAPGFAAQSLREERIRDNCDKSLAALRQDKVDIYYLHGPDRTVPLEEQCRAIDALYRQGKFERFGVSNLADDEVRRIHTICRQNHYVLPSVYQGVYNPIARGTEATLFPLLGTLDMAFYAFSPLAGGLLAKSLADITSPAKGSRFHEMKVFADIYLRPDVLAALAQVQQSVDADGITLLDATMRWFMHHAPLRPQDGVILGASTEHQINRTLSACQGPPLSQALQDAWDGLEQVLKHDPLKYHS